MGLLTIGSVYLSLISVFLLHAVVSVTVSFLLVMQRLADIRWYPSLKKKKK